ncbi:hypothetical protein A2Z22_03435 [Candidatus Woesebacteria bacterium RBG_16_34_12]|uniref:SCP domain-containing protein n=1 Tax=Candidatus Woesebacteria bacterium RBG_16_34_12 TaxID=1802480 RepID=A0A1F7XAR6_9BACT|nr:MAG: hypothetical protein A2Z22_03435 [Candidatus Woesebacteria bacterium RBG_16_34_12]
MSLNSIQSNWIDLVILIILAYFVSEAFRVGFWIILADFISFSLSLVLSFLTYPYIARLLRTNFAISHSFSNALGFLFSAVIIGAILGYILSLIIHKIPRKYWNFSRRSFWSIFPAIGEGLVLIAFILTLSISLPLNSKIKTDLTDAKIGGIILKNTAGLNSNFNDIFGKAIEDSLAYLIVRPESKETIQLTVGKTELSKDQESEVKMFNSVNEERRKHQIAYLIWDNDLANISEDYAMDMWQRTYFSHYSPEGENVGDRLKKAEISFVYAAENLAMAPTVTIAHAGLMNSEGHKANILDNKFSKIGIGVIDNGIYGKIFVQVFTD